MARQEQPLSSLRRSTPATVGILLYPEVEVLDFAGPYEVFSVAARIAPKVLRSSHLPFEVITVAEAPGPVIARHGLHILPDYALANSPAVDILIVPGGVVDEPLANRATLDWLRCAATRAVLTASVCTGAFILARIGLLDGLTATTHWEDVPEMTRLFPGVTVVEGPPYVDQGAVVTSAGISAGIDMSLYLVGRFVGSELARLTARQMQYDWSPVVR